MVMRVMVMGEKLMEAIVMEEMAWGRALPWFRSRRRTGHRPLQLSLQPIRRKTEGFKKICTDPLIAAEGNQEMGKINQARTPALLSSFRRLQQFLEILTDEQLIAPPDRLIGKHILQAIQKGIGRQ